MKNKIYLKVKQQRTFNTQRSSHGMRSSNRKQWGNTLVPVVIGIAITAVATVSFLNQGSNLAEKNKLSLAQNEISKMVYEWNLAKANNLITAVDSNDFSGLSRNVYGQAVTFKAATASSGGASTSATLTYPTDSSSACDALDEMPALDGVASYVCASAIMTITLN